MDHLEANNNENNLMWIFEDILCFLTLGFLLFIIKS